MNKIRNNVCERKTQRRLSEHVEKRLSLKTDILLEEERYENWKEIWRKLKNIGKEGTKKLRTKRFDEKKMQLSNRKDFPCLHSLI